MFLTSERCRFITDAVVHANGASAWHDPSLARHQQHLRRPRMKLPAHNRYDYDPITKRAGYTWPDGKRLAVYFCNNI